ncbi:uncharacterized protein LOC121876307 isoform X2 [Homarus americanus]|nr:uncharacterized protein LOC121876307 isoform X2 [Homarus americanus]
MDYFQYHQCTSVKDSTSSGYQNVTYIDETLTSLDVKGYGSTETEATMEEAVASILGEKMKQPEPQSNTCSLTTFSETAVQVNLDQQRDPSVKHMPVEDTVIAVPGLYQAVEPQRDVAPYEGNQMQSGTSQYIQQSIEHLSIVDQPAESIMEHVVENVEPSLSNVGHAIENVESTFENVGHVVQNTEPNLRNVDLCVLKGNQNIGNVEQMHIGSGIVVESVEIPSSNVYIYDNPVYLNRLMKDNTCGRRARHDAPYTHRLGPWDDKSSQLLIQLLKEYPEAYFILGKDCKRTEAWELIRYKLGESGFQFTVLQIRMRWREICKRYRNVVNHNDLHDEKRTCQYFDDLNNLFGIWDSQATQFLIQKVGIYSAKRLGQNGGTRMRHKAWQQMQGALAKEGYEYTADQVHGRWNALVTLYQRMMEHNSNQSNEPMTVAYQDAIESVFKYVPERKTKLAKIREKQGQSAKVPVLHKKWSLLVERLLLRLYLERSELFIKNKNKKEVWEQIVKSLKEEGGYHTTVEKVRARFYELSKQYEAMLHHNSQPGTLYRESRHHEMLADIYSRHNSWPHDGSTVKSDNSNSLRMRQMKAQMMWSDEESRVVLTLYPQVLIEHLRNGYQPPLEELWVQLAKDLFSTYNFLKQPYEIEEHIALLRQGYRSQNPFPFRPEMELLEETEHTLCFSPESPSKIIAQMVQYWSHSAAHCLLDFVIHYYQEGIKLLTESLFDTISVDMENLGYRYTSEECRQYYHLLNKKYKKKIDVKNGKDIDKKCPYMKKMVEIKTVMSQTEVPATDDVCNKIISAASSVVKEIKGTDKESRRESLERMILKLKMHLMNCTSVRPPPSVKTIAQSLLKFLREDKITYILTDSVDTPELSAILHPHVDILKLISQNGPQHLYQDSHPETDRKRKIRGKMPLKSTSIQWTIDNVSILLETVREWQLLCHDDEEVAETLAVGQPLWHEVAYKLSRRLRKCPDVCHMFFVHLCQDYARLELSGPTPTVSGVWFKNQKICDLLRTIVSPVRSCDAEWDVRDAWWVSEAGGWSREEIMELLFTVKELWSGEQTMDWKLVNLLLSAGGYQRGAKCFYTKFHQLYSGYQRAFKYNQECSIRERRRPPFYFKIHSLFGYQEAIPGYHSEPKTSRDQKLDIDEQEVIEILLAGLKDMKNLVCHSIPRQPLLLSLAHYLDEQYQYLPATFTQFQVWHLLVQLHNAQHETAQEDDEGPFGVDLDGLWQHHTSPLVAYGLHAVPLPGWQSICDWSMEELDILVKTSVEWQLDSSNDKSMDEVSCEALQAEDYTKTAVQCRDQWQYMVNTIKHGGYQQYKHQIGILYLLQNQNQNSLKRKGLENTSCKRRKGEKQSCPLDSGNVNSNKDNFASQHSSQMMCDNFSPKEGKLRRITSATNKETPKYADVQVGKSNHQYTDTAKSNKIRVKVLSIVEKENSKVIECQAQDVKPDRIIKLHYPVTHPIPANIKYINIPKMLVYPSYTTQVPQGLPPVRIRDNSNVSCKSNSALNVKKPCNTLAKSIKEKLHIKILHRLEDTYKKPQNMRIESFGPVKKNKRILSLPQLTSKKDSSKTKLKMLRRRSQLQLKKSRKLSQLLIRTSQSESPQGQSKFFTKSHPNLIKKRQQEASNVSFRKLNNSKIEIKKSRNCSQLRPKTEQNPSFQLPTKNGSKESCFKLLKESHHRVNNSRKRCHNAESFLDISENTDVDCLVSTAINMEVTEKKREKEEDKGTVNKPKKIEERKRDRHEEMDGPRRDAMNILNQYHLQYDQQEKLLGIIQDNSQEEKFVFSQVISLIEEIHSHFVL